VNNERFSSARPYEQGPYAERFSSARAYEQGPYTERFSMDFTYNTPTNGIPMDATATAPFTGNLNQ
jgi:hypothetical protein